MSNYHSNAAFHASDLEWPKEENIKSLSESGDLPTSVFRAQAESSVIHEPTRAPRNTAFLRLTVLSSTVLSLRGVVLVDSHDEISIGRDRCATPRLRLKEFMVSKYHASIYWDSETSLWSLVDMGSTHGTDIVCPDSPDAQASASISDHGYHINASTRLSPPKTASLPRPLFHLQHIIIGGTTLVVHIHSDQLPCNSCTVTKNNLISLDTSRAGAGTVLEHAAPRGPELTASKSLKALKRDLLSRSSYLVSPHDQLPTASTSYIDRSKLRRQRFPGWRDPDTRGKVALFQDKTSRYQLQVSNDPRLANIMPTQDPTNALPIPLTNVGHRLLEKQGWTPGSVLGPQSKDGEASNALAEPLVLASTANRRGLGMKPK